MLQSKIKQFTLLFGLLFLSVWSYGNNFIDGYSHIQIKEAQVQGPPKGSSIQATIDGHYLTIVFLENLGQVHVVVTTDTGGEVDAVFTETPNGLCIYIPNTGSFIVTFTLPNGDEYYGEFEVRE